jgi:hypothetical protein
VGLDGGDDVAVGVSDLVEDFGSSPVGFHAFVLGDAVSEVDN